MVDLNLDIPDKFFEGELRDGYFVTPEMKKVWAVELDLLNEFIKMCNANNLKWFADAGTVLGAIRHGGMIPWDDDIDVMMLRDDYDRFCELAPKWFKYPYFFQSPKTDPGSIYFHAKIRNSDTTAILNVDKEFKYPWNQGIFLDVFPIDNIPSNKEELNSYVERISSLRIKQMVLAQFANTPLQIRLRKNLFKLVSRILQHHFWKQISLYINYKHEKELHKYENSETENIAKLVVLPFKERRLWSKDLLKDSIVVPFEMLEICIPAKYEEFLNKFYGNWRIYEKGTSTHGSVFFDTENSYKNYIKRSR